MLRLGRAGGLAAASLDPRGTVCRPALDTRVDSESWTTSAVQSAAEIKSEDKHPELTWMSRVLLLAVDPCTLPL